MERIDIFKNNEFHIMFFFSSFATVSICCENVSVSA